MPRRLKPLRSALGACGDSVLLLACWALWLVLGVALAVQAGIALSHELVVPKFVIRSLEQRLAASGLTPEFGRATFDPGGGILLERLALSLPAYAEPVARARAVYVELDPWLLLAGRFEARRLHATGVELFVPAMLAPSGRSEEMLGDLELVLSPQDDTVVVEQFAARIAGVTVTARGALQFPRRADASPRPLLAPLTQNFPAFCRRLIQAAEHLRRFEAPELHVTLTPSPRRGAIATVSILARRLELPELRGLAADRLVVAARLPVFGDAPAGALVTFSANEVRVRNAVARGVHARIHGTLTSSPPAYAPHEADVTIADLAAQGFNVRAVFAHLTTDALPQLHAHLVAALAGGAVAVDGATDLAARSAALRVTAALPPALLEPIGALLGRDVRRFIGFGAPVEVDLAARFAPGGKFVHAAGHVAARQIDAYGVPIDAARGEIEFDGRRFIARHARATLGDNFARGSFEQDLVTLDFRFLLEGRLRPLAIGGWFREWWPNFFENFGFPAAPPDASVDVAGRWRFPHETTVFVFAESRSPIIRGAALDYARTRIFTRPNFIDGLELFGTRGAGEVAGTFTRHIDLASRQWRAMDIALASSVDLDTGAKLLGPELGPRLAPFAFETPPRIRAITHFEGPASPNGPHQTLRISGESTGAFTFYGFPARQLSFDATLRDDELTLPRVQATVAEGILSGNARLWGAESDRRLGFDAALEGASLGRAIVAVSDFIALRRGTAPTPASATAEKFITGKNKVRLDLALSAEGRADDPYSYRGNGNVALEGAELGEVRLLGLLSALLDFTALRFTSARGDFQLDRNHVMFPTFNVTGENSAIHAHGDYWLDRRALDFNARVYPFLESKSLLQSVVGAVLTPLSTMLEVKLTGPLDDPSWAFVIGPTNFFRSLSQPENPEPPTPLSPIPAAPASSPQPP